MNIRALTTGVVRLKRAFLYPRQGWRRQIDLFLPGPWCEPVPIHCRAVEHDGRLLLVDTGETAQVRDIPFARFDVPAAQELPGAVSAVGLSIDDVDTVVLTHMHGDHMDGAVHIRRPVLVHDTEWEFAHTRGARATQRLLRQPIPAGVQFERFRLDGGGFGAFSASRPLTADGRIVAVDMPGHTPGHVSVICIDEDGRHVVLAGDATDSEEQLRALRPGAISPKPAVAIQTMQAILAHAREHPAVYLPAHDPESVARLAGGKTL